VRADGARSATAPWCITVPFSLPLSPNRPLNVSWAEQRYVKRHVWWSLV
jgi:hypothetical protein